MDFEINKRVEEEKQRIIKILKSNGITENSNGETIENMFLFPLTIMANKLNLNN